MNDGLMVLGMHRSGTSLMARSLMEAGVDIGARLLGGSAGNPDGHFEDAVVVEHDERLLASLGRRWDELPVADERALSAAERASFLASVSGYLVDDRGRRPHWAIKDPRLCLFTATWRAAIEAAGARPSALLVIRHPVEVARSLAARDGLPFAQGWLLWFQYVMASLRGSDGLARRVVSYDALIASPADAIARVATLPGWHGLRAGEVHASLARQERRHHRVDPDLGLGGLPRAVVALWRRLAEAAAGDGCLPADLGASLDAASGEFEAIASALASAWRAREQALWSRIARAEAPPATPPADAGAPVVLDALQRQHAEVIRAISDEIHLMQATTASAMQQLGAKEGAADVAGALGARMEASSALLDGALAALGERLDALPSAVEASTAGSVLTALDHAVARIEAEAADGR